MRPYADSPWADERNIAELRRLWPLPDWSAKRIGEHLGVSRNSIISAARRLRLERFPNPVKYKGTGSKPHRTRKPKPKTTRKPQSGAVVDLRSMWPRTGDSPKVTYTRRKRHLDYSCDRPSDYQTCQWPLWDDVPDGRYCGEKTVKGRSFCQFHCETAYRRDNGQVTQYRKSVEAFANFISKLDAKGTTVEAEPLKVASR